MTDAPGQRHVAELVRAQIADGTLKPGQSTPSAPALSRATGRNPATCLRALRALVEDGTLEAPHSAQGRPRVPGGATLDQQDLRPEADALSRDLGRRRRGAGMTQRDLARLAGVSVTTVGHAETMRLWHGRGFWETADKLLGAGGELLALLDAYTAAAARGPLLPLTVAEREAVKLAGELYTLIAREIVPDGPARAADLAEVAAHVHAVQNAVKAQAAARLYPAEFRLLGEALPVARHGP